MFTGTATYAVETGETAYYPAGETMTGLRSPSDQITDADCPLFILNYEEAASWFSTSYDVYDKSGSLSAVAASEAATTAFATLGLSPNDTWLANALPLTDARGILPIDSNLHPCMRSGGYCTRTGGGDKLYVCPAVWVTASWYTNSESPSTGFSPLKNPIYSKKEEREQKKRVGPEE
jgi:hypothetical protein